MFTPLKQDETIKKEYERIQLNRWSLLFFLLEIESIVIAQSLYQQIKVFEFSD